MKKTSLLRPLVALAVSALLLSACGGGGGGGDSFFPDILPSPGEPDPAPTPPSTITATTPLGNSIQYEGRCDVDNQRKFVRSYLDEVYLWYNEIVDVDPNQFATTDRIDDYFNALLVRTPDATGLPKDRFSAVLPAFLAQDLVKRAPAARLASPGTALASHTDTVPVVRVVTSPGGRRAGYIQFNEHETGAQDDLIAAFRQLQPQGIQDLVLDLRFNSGGFLYIALTAASMITGPASEGKVFERLQYNNKRQAETDQSTLLFSGTVQFGESQNPVGTQLPQLSLPRVFVLASPRTCSASESIINALQGIDVQVIRIGTTEVNEAGIRATCGKPYGFHQKNNCGWAFFPIEFKGTNAKGFGDYTTGIRHNCEIADSSSFGPTGTAGTASDPLLNGALTYMDTGACPSGTASGVQASGSPILDKAVQPNRPSWAGRLLLPQQKR